MIRLTTFFRRKSHIPQFPFSSSSSSSAAPIAIGAGIGVVGIAAFMMSGGQKQETKSTSNYTPPTQTNTNDSKNQAGQHQTEISNEMVLITKLRDKAQAKVQYERDSLKHMFDLENQKMLRYQTDPNALDMLVNYTIFPDIKFYYVEPQVFYMDEKKLLKSSNFDKYPIRNSRLNTKLIHAIEAERSLKSVFVKIDDVKKQIEEQGFYKPPGIFMRYYGYVYLQIRKKPIEFQNLQKAENNSEEHISLFDLFFKYQSPVPFLHNEWNQFQAVMDSETKSPNPNDNLFWLGNIMLNQKPLPKFYLSGNVQNIFMQKHSEDDKDERRYLWVWGNHYKFRK